MPLLHLGCPLVVLIPFLMFCSRRFRHLRVPHVPKASQTLRHQLSSTEESGGEEILYHHEIAAFIEYPRYAPSLALSVESRRILTRRSPCLLESSPLISQIR